MLTLSTQRMFRMILFCSFLIISFQPVFSQKKLIQNLRFNQLSTLNGLPTNEVHCLYQDKDGYIWMATTNGLCQFDGYQVKIFKSNLYTPGLLTNNNISSLAEDSHHNLYIGTFDGLNIMDKTTQKIRKSKNENFRNNLISNVLITKNDQVLIGTDTGLFQYFPENDSCSVFDYRNTRNIFPRMSVKSLIEDSEGFVWIGSWTNGFYRFDPKTKRFFAYPQINKQNSAHVIFEDSHNRIWIGSWREGLFLLKNAYDTKNVSWETYTHKADDPSSLSDNFVYAISEDTITHTLWVGTRGGLSISELDTNLGSFTNYLPNSSKHSISYNEVNSIIRDNSGMMWLGMLGGGVNCVNTMKPQFNLYRLESIKKELSSNSVRSLFVDDEGLVWMGIGSYGLVVHDRKTDNCTHYLKLPDFSGIKKMPTVNTIVQSEYTNAIWFGTYDGGILIYDKKAPAGSRVKSIMPDTHPWLQSSCVYSLKEDSRRNWWIATRNGLSVLPVSGQGYTFSSIMADGEDIANASFLCVDQDSKGAIWLGTNNNGLVRAIGDVSHPKQVRFTVYNLHNNKLNSLNIQCLYEDSKKRLWIGTEGGGLNLYDRNNDTFIPVNKKFNLPGDVIYNIQEDGKGNLWMGTNIGLIRLNVSNDLKQSTYRLYTIGDGLQDNFFIRNASFKKNNEMFFGGHKGYNSFFPDKLEEFEMNAPIVITDIKIFNKSLSALDENVRRKISEKTPEFADKIKISHENNNFSIEFAELSYINPMQNKYAYKLEGFDKEWQYTDASRRFAYYNNLESGTYTFRLRATNENGIWCERETTLQVVILPPPWETWWAYGIYLIIFVGIAYFAIRIVKNRISLRNELQIKELEQAKSEELNHAKLQFFTNITHELLTPLTIISASLDELKALAPQNNEYYLIMENNINRLIRLLQQILEFRKAESGNLKLKVSKGDLAAFVKKSVDSFRPLMKKKKMHFSIVCDPESIPGYFDPDKLDKILYNLLSNASKYNKEGGFVQIDIKYDATGEKVTLSVKDNGMGISPQAMTSLFKRFYEGDYRRFNTIGTGIGLSLTKDLVELHRGTITVESEVGSGTVFCVTIPVDRSFYKDEEIGDDIVTPVETIAGIDLAVQQEDEKVEAKSHSILLVEDNEDLLQLMTKLLKRDYNIFTALNGKEGIVIVENEDIDLIVSDIMMPEMDGIEFCKYVKNNLDTSHIPVVLLTAKSKEEDRIEAYDSGADGFIIKPFNLTVLHAKIKNLLKGKERMAKDFKNQLVFEVKELNYTSIDEEFLKRAIDTVHRHLSDSDFDQQQFMEEMGTSKSTLYKKLKSLTGLNTSAFIRNIRLKAACKIAEEKKSIRISELAYAVGFNDPKYFSACFKKEFEMLPSEYIERFMPKSHVYEE